MNARDSLWQESPHGYRQLLRPAPDATAWWLNEPAKAANLAPHVAQLAVWAAVENQADKPRVAEQKRTFGFVPADYVATALRAGFREVSKP